MYIYIFTHHLPGISGFPMDFPTQNQPRIPTDPHLSKINSCRGSAAFNVSVGWTPNVCNLASARSLVPL